MKWRYLLLAYALYFAGVSRYTYIYAVTGRGSALLLLAAVPFTMFAVIILYKILRGET